MPLPSQLQNLVKQALAEVRDHPEYHLKGETRFNIYQSFGPSRFQKTGFIKSGSQYVHQEHLDFLDEARKNFTVADYALGWLAVLTIEKVLPQWEQYKEQMALRNFRDGRDDVAEILEAAIGVLVGTCSMERAFDIACDQYYTFSKYVTFDVWAAFCAANSALKVVIDGKTELSYSDNTATIDDSLEATSGDFASQAMRSYSVVDNNKPGLWEDLAAYVSVALGRMSVEEYKTIEYVYFDMWKRREFWEWWLSEAIPEAWRLAENNTASPAE